MAKKNSGGFKGAIVSGIVLVILVGALFGIAKANNINSIRGLYDFFRGWSDNVWGCGAGSLEWNCQTKPSIPDSNAKDGDNSANTGTRSNPTSTSSQEGSQDANLAALEALPVADAQKVEYKRSEWKHWIGSPCNTREAVLQNQGQDVKTDPTTCKPLSGTWIDPYSGKTIDKPGSLDIDHVIPLGYAASHGGQSWSVEKKQEFANDTSQLLAVSASENRSKSDKGPGEYMPPNQNFQCTYSKMWVNTASKYGVSISNNDKNALEKGLQQCSS